MSALRMYRGDSRTLQIAITRGGSPEDITGAALRFTAKPSSDTPDSAPGVIRKTTDGGGITVVDALLGTATVQINPRDTAGLRGDVTLYYDVQLRSFSGTVETVDSGTLTVVADLSRLVP